MNAKFPREFKLKKTDEYSSVFSFRNRIFGEKLIAHFQPNQFNHARLGLVISKKVVKFSVRRNYMRRVLRELFRHHQSKMPHMDLIIRAQTPFCKKNYNEIVSEFDMLVSKLEKRYLAIKNKT
jgi:ribonuclease P protein component